MVQRGACFFFSQVATATLCTARILVIVDEITDETLVGNSTGYCVYPVERDTEGLFIGVPVALALDAMTYSCVDIRRIVKGIRTAAWLLI